MRAERGLHVPVGETVRFDLNPDMVRFFHPQTEHTITPEAGV